MKTLGRRILTLTTAALLLTSIELTALADTWYLENGDVVVTADTAGQVVTQGQVSRPDAAPVITQQDSSVATGNTITVNAENGADANVIIQDVTIQGSGEAAMTVNRSEGSEVTVELNGENVLTGGGFHAGLETVGEGKLIVQDVDQDGSVIARGGVDGAGIGGADEKDGTNITIEGGTITALGGGGAAGIGGGEDGAGDQISIHGGEVTAQGGVFGAGIGGSNEGSGTNITISGGSVKAFGGSGAGIGGGSAGNGGTIIISGGAVEAVGGGSSAGIGGGSEGNGENITISGGVVKASGASSAAGIGGGYYGEGNDITITGGDVEVAGGSGGAGIGGGHGGAGTDIEIQNGSVIANGGLSGAGIGGGYGSVGSEISVSGGEVTAQGGMYAAGIGGGNRGVGSDINITGGSVRTAGGKEGAGIGGGTLGKGESITITGGSVTAQGGSVAAGIGGGYKAAGNDVVISGGTVEAKGGTYAAGIGGGTYSTGNNLVVKHQANVTALGQHDAADSGNGQPVVGPREKDNVDLEDLYTTGSYTNRYGTVYGTKTPPEPPVHECSSGGAVIYNGNLYCGCGRILKRLFTVNCPWKETLKDGVLTVTVDERDAILTYWLFGIQALVEQDVHTLVFATQEAQTVLELNSWLETHSGYGDYRIIHKGTETSLSQIE